MKDRQQKSCAQKKNSKTLTEGGGQKHTEPAANVVVTDRLPMHQPQGPR